MDGMSPSLAGAVWGRGDHPCPWNKNSSQRFLSGVSANPVLFGPGGGLTLAGSKVFS